MIANRNTIVCIPVEISIINKIAFHIKIQLAGFPAILNTNIALYWPAISKHIKILTQCGLISIRKEGRERYCRAELKSLDEAATCINQYRKFWEAKLDSLENYLDTLQTKTKKHGRKI